MTSFLTFKKHLNTIRFINDPKYKFCDKEKTDKHIMCDCDALMNTMIVCFEKPYCELGDFSNIEFVLDVLVQCLINCIDSTYLRSCKLVGKFLCEYDMFAEFWVARCAELIWGARILDSISFRHHELNFLSLCIYVNF